VLVTLANIPASGFQPGYRVEVVGSPTFGAEINHAYELGWRWRLNPRFHTDLAAYQFEYENVRNLAETTTFEPGPPPALVQRYTITNDGGANAHGAELIAHYRVSDQWELSGGVARGLAHAEGSITNPLVQADYAVADWLWHVRSWWQFAHDVEFSTALYGTGENDVANVPAYLRLDAQLAWHPRPDLELTIGIQNAGDPHHSENITADLTPTIEVRRNVFARIQWRF
jgi:outer membrane receptor protein involved in Fe transport